jgi:capsule polysaccharide export protein KpsE/RkpR
MKVNKMHVKFNYDKNNNVLSVSVKQPDPSDSKQETAGSLIRQAGFPVLQLIEFAKQAKSKAAQESQQDK